MPRLDGVDQREVGDDPGEERPFGIAGAAEEERRGRQVVDRLDADLGLHGLDARDPDPGFLLALLGFLAIVAGERFGLVRFGLAAVAVVGLVVDDDDVLLGAQLAADAADHLVGRFGEDAGHALGEDRLGQLAGARSSRGAGRRGSW